MDDKKRVPSKHQRAFTAGEVERLLYGTPDGDSQGRVEVRRYVERSGRFTYNVNQYGNHGGWASDATYHLGLADLAAETLAIRIRAELLVCKECDAELEGRS